jgi:CheY-like chemotaxis protein
MPIARPRRTGAGPADELPVDNASLNGMTVLLVEDDPETQAALAELLKEAGASVTAAANANEALAAYGALQPSVVLSDIGLPDSDGYTLLGNIRALERAQQLPETPAIALTAYAGDEDRRNTLDAGFVAHLTKPVDPDVLMTALFRAAAPRRSPHG